MRYIITIPMVIGSIVLSSCATLQREYNFGYDEKSGWTGGVVIKPISQQK